MKKNMSTPAREANSSKPRKKKMPPRSQILRLARIVSLLKKKCRVSAKTLEEEFKDLVLVDGVNLHEKYHRRTVCRDIALLRSDFKCPVKFDFSRNTYYLEDPKWEFDCPANLSEPIKLALIVGGRIAEEIFPDPLRARIKTSVDELLKGNSPEFLETTLIPSLKVFVEGGAAENPSVFSPVFEAWQKHRRIHIRYSDQHGNESERDVEPQVLFLYQHEWRIKGFCSLRKADRTFVINRMKNVWLLDETFEPNQETIDSVTLDSVVEFKKISGVKIKLKGDAVKMARSTPMHSQQKVRITKNGGLFIIPEIAPEIIVPWMLSQGGDAIPLEPPELVEAFRVKIQSLAECVPPKQ
jgi:predicted DNA-binding transcriptional regulator YafY